MWLGRDGAYVCVYYSVEMSAPAEQMSWVVSRRFVRSEAWLCFAVGDVIRSSWVLGLLLSAVVALGGYSLSRGCWSRNRVCLYLVSIWCSESTTDLVLYDHIREQRLVVVGTLELVANEAVPLVSVCVPWL